MADTAVAFRTPAVAAADAEEMAYLRAVAAMEAEVAAILAQANIKVDDRTIALTVRFLQCRKLGHAWEERRVDPMKRLEALRDRELIEEVHCPRCDMTRTDFFGFPSRVRSRSPKYDRPDGYSLPPGSGWLGRADVVVALLLRELDEAKQALRAARRPRKAA